MPMRLPCEPRDSVSYLKGYYDAKLDYEVTTALIAEQKWMVNRMKVIDKIDNLKKQIDEITDWYCDNCQEWDCSFCPYDYKGGEHHES